MQLAAVRQFPREMHGVALLLQWPYVLLWEIVSRSPSVVLVPRLGGWGIKIFQIRLFRRALHLAASGAQGTTLEPLSVVPHARGVVENLFSTASGPVSTALRSRSGAAFCCWLGPWLHAALLCCIGPCPHDPRDVA